MTSTLPDRPARAYVPLWKIASYWATRGIFWVELDYPWCFGCGKDADVDESMPRDERWNAASTFLERAHLADRAWNGLDQVQNIVPLCGLCHRVMPSFTDGREAIKWVQGGGHRQVSGRQLDKLIAKFRRGDIDLTQFGTRVASVLHIPKSAGIQIVTEAEDNYRRVQRGKKPPTKQVPAQDMMFS
jgi:hypothetical protein